MTRRHTKIILAAALVATFAIAETVFAQTTAAPIADETKQFTLWNLFNFPPECKLATYNYTLDAFIMIAAGLMWGIITITGSLAVLMFMYGGVQLLISQGEKGKISNAKTTIKNAVIGIGLILGAWLIVNTVIGFLIDPSKLPTAAKDTTGGITITNAEKTSIPAFKKLQYWATYSATPCVSVVSETIRPAAPVESTGVPPTAKTEARFTDKDQAKVQQNCPATSTVGGVVKNCTVVKNNTTGNYECQCASAPEQASCLQNQIKSDASNCTATCNDVAVKSFATYSGSVEKSEQKTTSSGIKYACCTCARRVPQPSDCGAEGKNCCAATDAVRCQQGLACQGSGSSSICARSAGATGTTATTPTVCGQIGQACCTATTQKAACGDLSPQLTSQPLQCDRSTFTPICKGLATATCSKNEDCFSSRCDVAGKKTCY